MDSLLQEFLERLEKESIKYPDLLPFFRCIFTFCYVFPISELNDVPESDRYDCMLNPTPFVEGVSLCPKCESPIAHRFKLEGAHFIGMQTFKILKICYECKTSWVAEIKVLISRTPTYHVVEGKLVPDESTARQDFLNALQEATHGRDSD